jgi:hypothetical protein
MIPAYSFSEYSKDSGSSENEQEFSSNTPASYTARVVRNGTAILFG